MEPQAETKTAKASDNEAKLRAVTLAIARTKVKWGERGVIEMYRRMAIAVLDETKSSNEIKDTWSAAYDDLMGQIEKEAAASRRYR